VVALILCLMSAGIVFGALKIKRKVTPVLKTGFAKFEANTLAAMSKFEASANSIANKLEAFSVEQENKKKTPKALSESLFAIMSKIINNTGVQLIDGEPELSLDKETKKPVGCKFLFKVTTPNITNHVVLSGYVAFDTGYATIVLFTPGMQKAIAGLSAGHLHKEPSVIRSVASNKLHAIMNSEDEIDRIIGLIDEEADEEPSSATPADEALLERLRQIGRGAA
jgi:hypothetical protein